MRWPRNGCGRSSLFLPSYAFFTSFSFSTSPTITSTPLALSFAISSAFFERVPQDVKMPTFWNEDLASTSDAIMYLPMMPVAPKSRTLEGSGAAMIKFVAEGKAIADLLQNGGRTFRREKRVDINCAIKFGFVVCYSGVRVRMRGRSFN